MKNGNISKVACFIGALAIALAVAFPETAVSGSKTYKWKIGQPYPKDTLQYELTEDWIKRIETASDGRIKITHYPGSLLGDYVAQAEAVAIGSQEITLTWPTTSVAGPGADLCSMGYIFGNWKEYTDGMTGWMYDLQKRLYKDIGWEILGSIPDGFSIVVSTKEYDPMPGPKELKIRLMPTETVQVRFKEMGFRTLSMPMSEFVTALSLGTVDAGGNAAWAEAWYNYKDVIKYIYNSRDMTNTMFLIMNKDLFSSLSDDDKKLISKISHEWTMDNYAAIMKENIKYRKQLEEFGLKIIDYTPEQWLENGKICRAREWPLMEEKVGKEVMDIVRKNAVKF